ncbi:MAG TPA: hypothetical protein VMJ10_33520 [Kofleriaceae bacterium]|nr:hypothetical protein [Kofleriaceae bacterium]
MQPPRADLVARGPGPRELRIALIPLAVIYFAALLCDPAQKGPLRSLAYFTNATKLFPERDEYALEYRLEGWSCTQKAWLPLDPRPYFPMEADDKESRFQRIAYFYAALAPERVVMNALDDYILAHHAAGADDHFPDPLGGIRLVSVRRPLPDVGDPVERYVYEPLAPIPPQWRKDYFWTKGSVRKKRCGETGSGSDADADSDSGR